MKESKYPNPFEQLEKFGELDNSVKTVLEDIKQIDQIKRTEWFQEEYLKQKGTVLKILKHYPIAFKQLQNAVSASALKPSLKKNIGLLLDQEITVCAECFRACCWAGEFMCDDAREADVVDKTMIDLFKIEGECPEYWITALCENPDNCDGRVKKGL